ncbi:MAG: DUF445 family protein [Cytophagales bacterium]|nr:DUF445 family protein [Cytophagales bacterium]
MDLKLLSLPFIAGFIGWLTNWVAVKMLFHPKEKKKFLFIEIQGIFPKRQAQLAQKLGDVVANELISNNDIKSLLKDYDKTRVNEVIESHLDSFLKDKLKEAFPMLAMFLTDGMVENIKKILLTELDAVLPRVIESYVNDLDSKLDIKGMVAKKVEGFSSDKLEEILNSILKKEFFFIEIVGGVLGFLIGIIQIILVLL